LAVVIILRYIGSRNCFESDLLRLWIYVYLGIYTYMYRYIYRYLDAHNSMSLCKKMVYSTRTCIYIYVYIHIRIDSSIDTSVRAISAFLCKKIMYIPLTDGIRLEIFEILRSVGFPDRSFE